MGLYNPCPLLGWDGSAEKLAKMLAVVSEIFKGNNKKPQSTAFTQTYMPSAISLSTPLFHYVYLLK